MIYPSKMNDQQKEILLLLKHFFLLLQNNDPEKVYELLSPNLQRVTVMKQYEEKYNRVFRFGRKLVWINIFDMMRIKEGLLEITLMLCLLSPEADPNREAKEYKEEDKLYSAYKLELIYLDTAWWIDDIWIHNKFWDNEFKEYCQSQLN